MHTSKTKLTNKMNSKKLTIVIVTFESSKMISLCLSKIDLEKYDVIVADNNSSDNTVEIAKKFLPDSNILKLKQNSGFSRANNAALRTIKTDYALVLNPDAFIKDEDIEKILNFMEREPNLAIAGGVVHGCEVDEKGNIAESNSVFTRPSTTKKETAEAYFTRFITGAAMFLRMDVFRKIGFFNENFFLYCEDNEICKRAIKNGYQIAIVKDAKFFHCSGQSSPQEVRNHKISWHRMGWSKAFYISANHGVIVGKLAALRISLKYLFLLTKDFSKNKEMNQSYKYAMQGAFAYFVGKKAFDKHGNPYLPK